MTRRIGIAVAAGALLAGCHTSQIAPAPGSGDVVRASPPGDGGVAATVGDGGVAGPSTKSAVAPAPRPAKVKISVFTKPNKVKVSWGKKLLGMTPLTFDRPRDSGPLDLVLRSDGYFPVHTRVYTYRSDRVDVKLTKIADRMTLFGAKKELPPPALPDGGAPPPPIVPVAAPTPMPPKG